MGKKSPSTTPTSPTLASPTTLQHPRMDAPPPYDQVVSSARRSSSISMHSHDRMNPEIQQTPETGPADPATDTASAQRRSRRNRHEPKAQARREEGGCMNVGDNVDGCMNVGGGWGSGKTSGCMNIGGGPYRKTDGCMNYKSFDGCMNYKSSGGCLNYKVADDWEGNEGCLNFRRGGGACLRA